MKLADTFRENAANCAQLADAATGRPATARYRRMEKAWLDLAAEHEWLGGETERPPKRHTA